MLAESCGISETYFRKLFQRVYGLSPMDYITNQRISYARELLTNTGLSVEDISYDSGYKDPTYFCRIFKKATGMSPSEYRADAVYTSV
jgi:two-component system response regulator YesN